MYNLRESNLMKFRKAVSLSDWSFLKHFTSVNDCFSAFYDKFFATMSVIPFLLSNLRAEISLG